MGDSRQHEFDYTPEEIAAADAYRKEQRRRRLEIEFLNMLEAVGIDLEKLKRLAGKE